jgi:hypothetical protein
MDNRLKISEETLNQMNHCKCGNLKWKISKQCQDCYLKTLKGKNHPMYGANRKGIKNGNFIDGSSIIQHYCIDCGTKVSLTSYYGNCRCKSCARKHQYATRPETHPMKGKTGKLNPNYKEIKTISKKYYCIDCKEEVADYRCQRCQSCAAKYRLKDPKNHPSFIDGRSFEKYPAEFNEILRNKIRQRDNYTCQNCSMTEEEHLIVYGRTLHVHHIDYNRKNCKENNLIALCQGCNLRANSNRSYWQELYNNKIEVKNES